MTENFKKATKSFNEADEKFQELMETVNKKLMAINRATTSDNKELKCKDNKELGLFDKVALELREIENEDNIIRPNHYASDKGFEVFKILCHSHLLRLLILQLSCYNILPVPLL